MADKIRTGPTTPVCTFDHQSDSRANIPTAELESFARPEEKRSTIVRYPRDPTLDPQLVWEGKDEQDGHGLRFMATAVRHRSLSAGGWSVMTLVEQMANIGSEVGRAVRAKESGRDDRLTQALERALELFDLTLADARWKGRRREVCRARELVCDYLVGDNERNSTPESLDRYFLPFAVVARSSVERRF